MILYTHNTPEIFRATVYDFEQLRNSSLCNNIGDAATNGDLDIAQTAPIVRFQSATSLFTDAVLAIQSKQITTFDQRQRFMRNVIANGPDLDAATLTYYSNYVHRNRDIYSDNITQTNNTFGRLNNNYTGSNYDSSLLDFLKNAIGNCLDSPCNYFSPSNLAIGRLADPIAVLTPSVGPIVDSFSIIPAGVAGVGKETFYKIPLTLQHNVTRTTMAAGNAFRSVANIFNTATEVEEQVAALNQERSYRSFNVAKGTIFTTNTKNYFDVSKSKSRVTQTIARNLGDCYRIYDHNLRYNPFDPQHAMQPAVPRYIRENGLMRSVNGAVDSGNSRRLKTVNARCSARSEDWPSIVAPVTELECTIFPVGGALDGNTYWQYAPGAFSDSHSSGAGTKNNTYPKDAMQYNNKEEYIINGCVVCWDAIKRFFEQNAVQLNMPFDSIEETLQREYLANNIRCNVTINGITHSLKILHAGGRSTGTINVGVATAALLELYGLDLTQPSDMEIENEDEEYPFDVIKFFNGVDGIQSASISFELNTESGLPLPVGGGDFSAANVLLGVEPPSNNDLDVDGRAARTGNGIPFNNDVYEQYAREAIREYGLTELSVSDAERFFPGAGTSLTEDQWVSLMSAMARYESSFNPNTQFRESFNNSRGERVVSTGLMQVSYESVNGYRQADGSRFNVTTQQLLSPKTNLNAAAAILKRWVSVDGSIAGRTGGQDRGGARYWSVLRETGKVDNVAQITRRS